MVTNETRGPESEPILLSLRDASTRLCIAIPTLRRWLRQRRLAYVTCGRALRIEVAEIQRYIARNRRPARDEQSANPRKGHTK